MDEEDAERAQRELLEAEKRKKLEELEALEELQSEWSFGPSRPSVVRTPPKGFSTPSSQPAAGSSPPEDAAAQPELPQAGRSEKRLLSSPEEVQDAVRRRVGAKRAQKSTAPPLGGILVSPARSGTASAGVGAASEASAPAPSPQQPASDAGRDGEGLAALGKLELLDCVYQAVKGIGGVANATNKLNLADKAAIAGHSQDVLAVVAALNIRLADMEHQVTTLKLRVASMELQVAAGGSSERGPGASLANRAGITSHPASGVCSYAGMLKLPKGKPAITVQQKGPAVLFYPNSDAIKSSEQTKKELQDKVHPGAQGIQIQGIRRVGNGGVVVQTATAEGAKKLKEAAPPTLKVADLKAHRPLVAVCNLRADPKMEDLLEELHKVNLQEDPNWPKTKLVESCRLAFKKGRRDSGRTTVVLECTSELRDKLVGLGRIYIGWDEAEVCDFVRVTCCQKCQQYGHPEKHCRAPAMVCGRCGESGHKSGECQSATQCCATCKRFKRPEASTHKTAARDCPARVYAEQQAVNMTQYG